MQAWVMWRLKAGLLGIEVLLRWCAAAAFAKVGAAPRRRKGASRRRLSWLSQKATSPLGSSRTGETLRCSSAALAGGDPASRQAAQVGKQASSGCAGGHPQHHARCRKRIRPQLPRSECRSL
ncbi:uncharacterized protein PSANT_06690 [Moesziomyces antarcticus]|uniref:Secreted protein n=1 Tax=Pseudozyma antarctica TaxID=84753 RepID=A0A5C3FZL3_PSEA2|nr:uncharacterized protein PSANT_06690 [Moesziomyces antarcticus]